MRKSIVIFLVITMILPGIMLAGERMGEQCYHEGWHEYGKIIDMLELTDQQKEQIQEIRQEYRKKIIPLHADLKLARIDLRESFSDNRGEKQVKDAAEKVSEIRNKIYMLKIDERLDIRGTLTEEQLDKVSDLRTMWRHKRMRSGRHEGKERFFMKKRMMHRDCRH
jgi:Spy/CpxP family protein refolding chaperone